MSNRPGPNGFLDEAANRKMVAEFLAAGYSRERIVQEVEDQTGRSFDKTSVTRWKRDPRIKADVAKILEDRTLQVSRRIDSIIEGRLSQADDLSIKELIMIRKEFGGSTVGRKEVANDDVTADAVKKMEEPGFLEKLEGLFEGEPVSG